METISNVASNVVTTASKAIWGDQPAGGTDTKSEEPPSGGVQGKGTATDPYDPGNAPTPTTEREQPDLAPKPTIPPTDAFNSATAANASTLGHTTAVTALPDDSTSTSAATQGTAAIDPLPLAPETSPAKLQTDATATVQAEGNTTSSVPSATDKPTATAASAQEKTTAAAATPVPAAKEAAKRDSSSSEGKEGKEGKEKKGSKMERLKEKLHIGHKH